MHGNMLYGFRQSWKEQSEFLSCRKLSYVHDENQIENILRKVSKFNQDILIEQQYDVFNLIIMKCFKRNRIERLELNQNSFSMNIIF